MLMAHRSGDVRFIAKTAGVVVIADMVFTASAVVAQPITGYFLMRETGQTLGDFWIASALSLYAIAGIFWLPVVWIQARMRDLGTAADKTGQQLPAAYHRLFKIWFAFGIPGFGAVMAILWLMIAKPGW
jgi:uncharacterized membrane protein